jgi:hypothetical protein
LQCHTISNSTLGWEGFGCDEGRCGLKGCMVSIICGSEYAGAYGTAMPTILERSLLNRGTLVDENRNGLVCCLCELSM